MKITEGGTTHRADVEVIQVLKNLATVSRILRIPKIVIAVSEMTVALRRRIPSRVYIIRHRFVARASSSNRGAFSSNLRVVLALYAGPLRQRLVAASFRSAWS